MLLELVLTFAGGALGSSHCVAMCGSFALSVGARAKSWRHNLARQLVFSLGRVFTYSAAGAAIGYGGTRLVQALPVTHVQTVLGVVAGLVLVTMGLASAGVLPWRRVAGSTSPCLAGGFLRPFLTAPGWASAFLAGVLTGFLPCGLVYAFLALAGSSGSLWKGAALMAAFGAGTVPLLSAVGCGGSLLSLATRRRVFHAAAWCVVLTGVLAIARGMMVWLLPPELAAGCPLCQM
ncbi:MAG: sulfite exporter TauE/SafE family protein [Planctomycetia bacterium]|nr:sulfite exporter TauE/SafE family protein [Planctomycetia bacterium]